MSWDCPYLKRDGSCQLIGRECEPLAKGCILQKSGMSAKMIRVAKKNIPHAAPRPSGKNIPDQVRIGQKGTGQLIASLEFYERMLQVEGRKMKAARIWYGATAIFILLWLGSFLFERHAYRTKSQSTHPDLVRKGLKGNS